MKKFLYTNRFVGYGIILGAIIGGICMALGITAFLMKLLMIFGIGLVSYPLMAYLDEKYVEKKAPEELVEKDEDK